MKTSPSYFNWSLTKALNIVPDNFLKARIRILFTIILFSLLKACIVIGVSISNHQDKQAVRAIVAFIVYLFVLKFLLHAPAKLKSIAHFLLIAGTAIIWTNIFVYTYTLNLLTLQFVFMAMLGSFYTLGSAWGIAYSSINILPVLIVVVFKSGGNIYSTATSEALATPGPEIIIILNFITIAVSHYLFYKAFDVNVKQKEKLAESKSNFLSTMSHELRTPLNSVIGITELLLDDKPEERQKENLKILQLSARDLLSLINNILDFNKIDSDKIELESVSFNLAGFMRDACTGLKRKAAEKQLDFNVVIDEQLENIDVISDPTRLSQLVYNLVGNAIKFTDRGKVEVKLTCLQINDSTAKIKFSITDTGIGIDPDKHKAIFELFTQAESHITRKYGGTGLGLAIVNQVLHLFGTTLELESTPGTGSKFYFTIVFNIVPATTAALQGTISEKSDFSNLRILVAEDNGMNRLLMSKQLDKLMITSTIVENGKLAYEALLSAEYDAIFMDLHMPVMNGYESLKLIRKVENQDKKNIYVIAFTASITEQLEIMESGFDDFLYKPVNLNDLNEKLKKVAIRKKLI